MSGTPAEMHPMPAEMPTAILFDAGGTLVLQDPIELGTRLGLPIDPRRAHRAHYQAMSEYSDLRLAGEDADWDWWLERYFTILEVADPHLAGERIVQKVSESKFPIERQTGAREGESARDHGLQSMLLRVSTAQQLRMALRFPRDHVRRVQIRGVGCPGKRFCQQRHVPGLRTVNRSRAREQKPRRTG